MTDPTATPGGITGTPGGMELAVILFIAILIFGANKIPKLSRATGEMLSGTSTSRGQSYTQSDLVQASPKQFEQLVAKAWEQQGYSTTLTEDGPDQGIDVIASKGDEEVVIQAKCYQTENQVSAPTVRRVAGAREEFGADKAAIATSSSFTDPAEESAASLDVELVDGQTVARILTG